MESIVEKLEALERRLSRLAKETLALDEAIDNFEYELDEVRSTSEAFGRALGRAPKDQRSTEVR